MTFQGTLSFLISPNNALGFGVILTIWQHFADGDQMILDEIPHHNRASAEFTKRQIIAANR
tara:strand:- start:230 stop:412 length:183 start_codon:yes stop_codon:yes gene_type:complete